MAPCHQSWGLAPWHGVIPALEQPDSSSLWLSSLFSLLSQRNYRDLFIQCWAALLEPPAEEPGGARLGST